MGIKKPLIFCALIAVFVLLNFTIAGAVYAEQEKTQELTYDMYTTNLLDNLPQEPIIPSINGQPESELKYNGFIVSFPGKPVLLYKKDLQAQGKTTAEINSLVASYKNSLISKHNAVKQAFTKTPSKVGREFYDVYNGMTLYITEQECNQLVSQKLVSGCYKNYQVKIMLNESVPLINADDVWKLPDPHNNSQNLTGKGITIAIIDTGVDSTHPDLDQGKVVQEHCYCQGCCLNGQNESHGPGSAMDDYGHGTHCASIAAGTGEASGGHMKGVATDAKIEAIKVLDSEGSGYESDIISGVEKAVQDNVSVISLSIGLDYGYFDDCYEITLSNVTDNAVDLGINVVVAAGNSGSGYFTINAPGCAKKVITVGASDKQDQIARFSSRGPTNDFRVKPDVVAPGVNICAARWDNAWPGRECYGNNYISISGTSMATPHVAGLVALLKQKYPSWNPQEIKHAIRNGAVDIHEDILTQGYGRIDALNSVLSPKSPIARLDTSGIINGTINITGYVYAENFTKYRLEYGPGTNSTNWTLLTESQTPPSNEVLYTWNTSQATDGFYTLKLTVKDNNNKTGQDHSIIIISNKRNFSCSSCLECDFFAKISNSRINIINDLDGSNLYDCITPRGENISINCEGKKIEYAQDRAINLGQSQNIFIENCKFEKNKFGIVLWGSQNVTLRENNFNDNKQAIMVQDSPPSYFIDISNKINGKPIYYFFDIHNQKIENLYAGTIIIHKSSNITIRNNILHSVDDIELLDTNNSQIINNSILNTKAQYGIANLLGSNNIIKDNEITSNVSSCSNFFSAFYGITNAGYYDRTYNKNNIIENNLIFGFCEAGIMTSMTKSTQIKNNVIDGLSSNLLRGIHVWDAYNSSVINNTIYNTYFCVHVEAGWEPVSYTNITQNKISNCWEYGVRIYWSNNNLVSYNRIDNSNKGISLQGIIDHPELPKFVTYNNKIIANQIFNNVNGISLRGNSSNNKFEDNTINGSDLAIYIELSEGLLNIFSHNSILQNNAVVNSISGTELSYIHQGNYWNRVDYPYFCEYGNQNATCLNSTYDSNRPDVIDSCPYNQSYSPGQWPESPRCPQFCYMEGRTCVDFSGRHDPYCVGNAVHSYFCLNKRCVLNDAVPMCPYDQKCVNGTCVNLTQTQCESQGGICAETCPAGYYQADFSCTAPTEAPAATAAGEIQKATPKTGFFDWFFKILGMFFSIIPTPADNAQPLPPAPEAITPNETNETNTSSIQTGGTMPNIEPTPPEIQPDQQNTQVVTQPAETPQTSPTTPLVTRPTAQPEGTVTEPAKTVVPTTQTQTKTPTTTKTVCCMKI